MKHQSFKILKNSSSPVNPVPPTPPKGSLIYSIALIGSVFSKEKALKKHKIHRKQSPFIHQQPLIDVMKVESVTLSQPTAENLFVLLHF